MSQWDARILHPLSPTLTLSEAPIFRRVRTNAYLEPRIDVDRHSVQPLLPTTIHGPLTTGSKDWHRHIHEVSHNHVGL